jgi:hypothetical protein
MKIALEISGQPRGLPICLKFIKSALIDPNADGNELDIFIHAWHNEADVGKSYSSAQPSQNDGRTGRVKANTATILCDTLKPKKFLIEPQKEFPHLRNLKSEPSANQELLGSNFYSVYMANELKKQYEQENSFKYDIVIRTRYDLFYESKIKTMDYADYLDKIVVMEEFQNHQDWKNNPDQPMVDIFALGNSKNMDIFSSVYPNMESLNEIINPRFGENYLGRHVRSNNELKLHKAPFKIQILHRVIDLSSI